MGIRQIGIYGALYGFWFSAVAHACTVCDSSTGKQVRTGLFNSHFAGTLAMVSLPAVLLCFAVVAVYLGMPDLGAANAEDCRPDFSAVPVSCSAGAIEARR